MKTIAIALFVVLLPFAADASAQTRVRGAQDAVPPTARATPLRGGQTPNVHVRPHTLSPRSARIIQSQKIGATPGARAARLRRAVADAQARGIEINPRQIRRLQQQIR